MKKAQIQVILVFLLAGISLSAKPMMEGGGYAPPKVTAPPKAPVASTPPKVTPPPKNNHIPEGGGHGPTTTQSAAPVVRPPAPATAPAPAKAPQPPKTNMAHIPEGGGHGPVTTLPSPPVVKPPSSSAPAPTKVNLPVRSGNTNVHIPEGGGYGAGTTGALPPAPASQQTFAPPPRANGTASQHIPEGGGYGPSISNSNRPVHYGVAGQYSSTHASAGASPQSGNYCADPANKNKEVCRYSSGNSGIATTQCSVGSAHRPGTCTTNVSYNYSQLGMPQTQMAWDQQAAIDDGRLRNVYAETSRWNAMALSYCKANPSLPGCASVDKNMTMSSTGFINMNQTSSINSYVWLANNTANSAMILDYLPTNTSGIFAPDKNNRFQAGDDVTRSREISAGVADILKNEKGLSTYGLVIPYENSSFNVIKTSGDGRDVKESLMYELGRYNNNVTTVAVAYSQPSAGLQSFVGDTGLANKPKLDYAIAVAPMGGERLSGGAGNAGSYSGVINGISTLIVANEKDPANNIHTVNGNAEYVKGLIAFKTNKTDGPLHGDICSDGATCGYPKEKLQAEVNKLFAPNLPQYGYNGAWNYDSRVPPVKTIGMGDLKKLEQQIQSQPPVITPVRAPVAPQVILSVPTTPTATPQPPGSP